MDYRNITPLSRDAPIDGGTLVIARPADGVRAVCAPEGDERAALDACCALRDGKGEAWVTVHTTHVDDRAPICRVRFLVSVKHKG